MHLEFLVEDQSGALLLEALVPRLLGPFADPHTWKIHAYKGVGRIPTGQKKASDAVKRILLDQLPRLLRGYGQTPGFDAVFVVLDSDRNPCAQLLAELKALLAKAKPAPRTIFRLAIEEIEAWYLGDQEALLKAFPQAKRDVLNRYKQDAVCDTWELLADAIYPGGSAAILKAGWPLPGQVKSGWARRIGPLLDLERNVSPSFAKLRDGIRKLVAED